VLYHDVIKPAVCADDPAAASERRAADTLDLPNRGVE